MLRSTGAAWSALPMVFAITAAPLWAQTRIDDGVRTEVVNGVLVALGEGYVFPEIAATMKRAVRAAERAGRYQTIDDPVAFAAALTSDLRAVSKDGHLRVVYTGGAARPQASGAVNPAAQIDALRKLLMT